ncbi:hypothetical protein DMC63_34445, partial [Streptomyces sp. WAC 05977]
MVFESGDGPAKPPKALQNFLKIMVGMEWPEGNVRSMRAMSEAWSDFAPVAEDFAAGVRSRAADLDRSMDGEYARAMVEYLNATIAKSLDQLAAYARELAKTTKTAAANVEKAQILLIAAAVFAVAQIAFLAASLIFSWMIPAVKAATQLTMRMIIQQLLAKLSTLGLEKLSWEGLKQALVRIAPFAQQAAIDVGTSAAVGAGLMTSIDYFTQVGQQNSGQRDEIDGKAVWQAAVGGAIGGAASGVMTGGARVVVHVAQSAARDLGAKIPRGMVIWGQVGYAGGQVASVLW